MIRKSSITGIYIIVSPSGKVYIGQSRDIKNRWRQHIHMRRRGCPAVNNSLKKYGIAAHEFNIANQLPQDVSQEVLNAHEIFYLEQYKECGFLVLNLKEGGLNARPTEETKLKLSLAHKGKKHSLGTPMPATTRDALKKANTGRKMAPHLNKYLSVVARTPENAKRMGYLNRGKVRSEENKNKIRQTLKSKTDNKGELHPKSKLTNKSVLEIRNKYIPKIYGSRKLAKEYGISKTNVLDIVNNKIWNHIW